MSVPAIQAIGVSKTIGRKPILRDISFEVRSGEIVGLLGPNGAGKTTLLRMVCALLRCSTGQMIVNGFDAAKDGGRIRAMIGLLTENPDVYEALTAVEYLDFFARIRGLSPSERQSRVVQLLTDLQLEDRAGDVLATYSKGMKQRVCLARTLLDRPPLLCLDEPTSGLDPAAARQLKDSIAGLRMGSVTVLLSSHDLATVRDLCDRVILLNHGAIAGQAALRSGPGGCQQMLAVRVANSQPSFLDVLRSHGWTCEVQGEEIRIHVSSPERDNAKIIHELVMAGASIVSASVAGLELERYYLDVITGDSHG